MSITVIGNAFIRITTITTITMITSIRICIVIIINFLYFYFYYYYCCDYLGCRAEGSRCRVWGVRVGRGFRRNGLEYAFPVQ